jgi:uncharacterized membrane protein
LILRVDLVPFILLRCRLEYREALRRHKRTSLGVGLGSMGTYRLILAASRQAHASHVVAARELSIAIAVFLGVTVLKEHL